MLSAIRKSVEIGSMQTGTIFYYICMSSDCMQDGGISILLFYLCGTLQAYVVLFFFSLAAEILVFFFKLHQITVLYIFFIINHSDVSTLCLSFYRGWLQ